MPLNEFWHGDMRLLEVYQKAYYKNVTYTAWINGNYMMFAVEKGARNALAVKKEHIDRTWVDYVDITKKMEEPIITKDNLEEEFRKTHLEQNAWLSELLGNK